MVKYLMKGDEQPNSKRQSAIVWSTFKEQELMYSNYRERRLKPTK